MALFVGREFAPDVARYQRAERCNGLPTMPQASNAAEQQAWERILAIPVPVAVTTPNVFRRRMRCPLWSARPRRGGCEQVTDDATGTESGHSPPTKVWTRFHCPLDRRQLGWLN